MKKVFITRKFPQAAVKLIKDAGFTVDMWKSDDPVDYTYMVNKSKDIDGLICTLNDKINENFINSSTNLKIISTLSVGFDHIDVSATQKRNIKIGYTPGVLVDSTAELAIGLLLMVSRKLIEAVNVVKDGSWGSWKPFWMCGNGLNGSTIGIVGLGSIGKAIARRIRPFNVATIVACGSDQSNSLTKVQIDPGFSIQKVPFQDLLCMSDFIIISCALTDETKNLFNEAAFAKMKSNAILINISRGPVIDQEALYNSLINGKITAAGLDVCTPEPLPVDHPLLTLPNCVVLPHVGSATIETRNSMCNLAVENLVCGLRGLEMPSELKF